MEFEFWVAYSLVVCVLFGIIYLLIKGVVSGGKAILRTPLFAWNRLGSTMVVSLIKDVEKARLDPSRKVGNYIVVPVLQLKLDPWHYTTDYNNSVRLSSRPGDLELRVKNDTGLFVPGHSLDKQLTPEQEAIIGKNFSFESFVLQKRCQSLLGCLQILAPGAIRIATSWRRVIGGVCIGSFLAFALSIVLVVKFGDAPQDKTGLLITTPAGREVILPQDNAMVIKDPFREQVQRGKVVRIQPISRDLVHLCILLKNGTQACGTAPSTMRVGDVAFLRYAQFVTKTASGNNQGIAYTVQSWFVSESEGNRLTALGASVQE